MKFLSLEEQLELGIFNLKNRKDERWNLMTFLNISKAKGIDLILRDSI